MPMVPCRPAFLRAELFPPAPGILRKQPSAVGADVHVLVFSDDLFTHGIRLLSSGSLFALRRIDFVTVRKTRNIPEIR